MKMFTGKGKLIVENQLNYCSITAQTYICRAAIYINQLTLLEKKLKHFLCLLREIWNFSWYFRISKFLCIYTTISKGTLVGKHCSP